MSQRILARAEHARKKKRVCREKVLADIEWVAPWPRLIAVIEPLYPASGRVSRQYFGVDAGSGIVHSQVGTAANANDMTQTGQLHHGDVFGDAGYRGVDKREQSKGLRWQMAMQPGKCHQLSAAPVGLMPKKFERIKARIRAKIDHPFHVIKNLSRHENTRYRRLDKNHARLYSQFGVRELVDRQEGVAADSWRSCRVLSSKNAIGMAESRVQTGLFTLEGSQKLVGSLITVVNDRKTRDRTVNH